MTKETERDWTPPHGIERPQLRRAIVFGAGITVERVAAYLPPGYSVVDADVVGADGDSVVIEGEDRAGWTLDRYILPRLASGLLFGEELLEEDEEDEEDDGPSAEYEEASGGPWTAALWRRTDPGPEISYSERSWYGAGGRR